VIFYSIIGVGIVNCHFDYWDRGRKRVELLEDNKSLKTEPHKVDSAHSNYRLSLFND